MFEVESVPSRDNASSLLLLLSRHNVYKTNDERTIGCKVSQTSYPLSIRNSPHLKVSIRIYSYLKVKEVNERDVSVRIVSVQWNASIRWHSHLSAMIRY